MALSGYAPNLMQIGGENFQRRGSLLRAFAIVADCELLLPFGYRREFFISDLASGERSESPCGGTRPFYINSVHHASNRHNRSPSFFYLSCLLGHPESLGLEEARHIESHHVSEFIPRVAFLLARKSCCVNVSLYSVSGSN